MFIQINNICRSNLDDKDKSITINNIIFFNWEQFVFICKIFFGTFRNNAIGKRTFRKSIFLPYIYIYIRY